MDDLTNQLESAARQQPAGADDKSPTYVVGIGASAGGLEALEQLFDRLPGDTGMAFVVVQHLSPDHKSLMDEIIRRHTEMAVFRVTNGMEVRRNAVYLIPAGKEMIISEGCLLITDKDRGEMLTLPIDHFFRSLAHDCESNAIAIVLSGSGSDGSRGVRDVHNAGGLVITQDVVSSAFDSMPINSQDTGVVDIIGNPIEIADSLLRLVKHPLQHGGAKVIVPEVPEDGIKRVLREIRDHYGIDFTYYKPTTVVRRIERRLLLNHANSLDDYVANVLEDSEELNLLYKDLLIGVTQFFRDIEAFKVIEEKVIPEIILKIPEQQEIRVWSAACATGEEAYSLAIIIHERLTAMNRPINVRVFATDVHKTSLDFASAGVYPDAAFIDVSLERKNRYFSRTNDGWRIVPEIRNMVVFAPHNLIKDAPFTRLDLITCRNMLIYLQPLAQKKVLSLFHFALKTGGTLFLGPSETTGDLIEEFDVVDKAWRVSRKRRDIRLTADLRLPAGRGPMQNRAQIDASANQFSIRTHSTPVAVSDRELMNAYDVMLNDFVPTAFLMNDRNELVHSFGDLNQIVKLPTGRATNNVLDMLPTDLRTMIIGAIHQASRTGEKVTFDRVFVKIPGTGEATKPAAADSLFRVTVRRILHRTGGGYYSFVARQPINDSVQPTTQDPTEVAVAAGAMIVDDLSRNRIRLLETELRHSGENLQATIEELESSNEELQATNEEMVASNEELQSTNEELHSVNEELYTVNAEYQNKIVELTELTQDMDNLLNSTDVHTLFLDEELCIRKFTSRMGKAFNLITSDVGRSITGFSHNIPSDDLMDKLTDVLQNDKRYEEEIRMPDGGHFLMRVLPYRGESIRMGVVLTLLDITQSKHAEARFRATFDNAAVGIAHVAADGQWLRVNDRLCAILGYDREELLTKTFTDVTYADDLELDEQKYDALNSGKIDRYSLEKRYVRKDGDLVWISLTVSLQRDPTGEPQFAIAVVQDISKRKVFEQGLTEAVEQRDRFLATLSHELRNPLAAVRHATKLVHHPDASIEQREQAMKTIDRQTEQMTCLLEDLLDVSRVTQGKVVYEMKPLDMRDVLADARDAMQSRVEEAGHRLKVKVPKVPVTVMGDESRLLQVVENLLANSCKYTDDGGEITLSLRRYNGQCIVKVIDNGRGIESGLVENVFDMFVQSDSELARSQGGMGLGLTVVRSLIERHEGTITACSPGLGQGSTFTIRLPLTEEEVEEQQVTEAPRLDRVPHSGPIPIVLIEDNEDAREMLQDFLELEGYQVTACPDGRAGLTALIQILPSIALVDIGLPELTGYEVAQQFRAACPDADVYLIALSGYGQTGDMIKAEEAGFDSHMTKPIDPDELVKRLADLG
ncbi:putative sensor histidine kinase TcrY [Rubripirellula tenax]|uniref:histidine kinase n=1 Tax=Rubripirellula tenax TaxID=2528015 RepID=A0A5C6FGE3_9BACT|nr:CheR family methyltransferase [Rubripirellula tenax]TWU59156.1 putative sensor histidine kinase TcrY [Rubripirellula tenax]